MAWDQLVKKWREGSFIMFGFWFLLYAYFIISLKDLKVQMLDFLGVYIYVLRH